MSMLSAEMNALAYFSLVLSKKSDRVLLSEVSTHFLRRWISMRNFSRCFIVWVIVVLIMQGHANRLDRSSRLQYNTCIQ